ncbi:MAG: helix-turn-helix domain-containing protein [Candidatus Berkelbacteria bacterium]
MNKDLKQKLETIGLSSQDAEVYLALLLVGESSAGGIIDATNFHREIVYSSLGRLEREGLVSKIDKKRIKYFQAAEPKVLVRKIVEKAQVAKDLLPKLENIYTETPISVQIFEGSEGYEEIQKDIQHTLGDGEEFYVIGGSGYGWYEVTAPFWKTYQKKILGRKIKMLTVTSEREAKGIVGREDPRINTVRVMPANFSAPSSTLFYKDKVVIQIFGESPVAIMIKSKAVSEAYKKYFDALWSISKNFKY